MYKFIPVILVAMLAACSSTKDPDLRAAREAREIRVESAKKVIKEQPSWYKEGCPASSEIACATATETADNMQAAVDTAVEFAKGQICDTAGGQVDKVSKTFRTQEGKNSTTTTKTAIRSKCPGVDITGAKKAAEEVIALPDGTFQAYVKVVLPISENPLKDRKDKMTLSRENAVEGEKLLKELDTKQ
jgi:hypothetical protein